MSYRSPRVTPANPDRRRLRAAAIALVGVAAAVICQFVIPLTVLLAVGVPMLRGMVLATPTIAPARWIVADTVGVRLIWRRGNLVLPNFRTPSALACDNDAVVAVTYGPGSTGQSIEAFNPLTGETLWASSTTRLVSALTLSQGRIYAVQNWRLVSISASLGDTIWQADTLPDRTSYRISLLPDNVLMLYSTEEHLGSPSEVLRFYDSATGELVQTEAIPLQGPEHLELRTTDVDIWADHRQIQAVDRRTNETLWSMQTNGPVGAQSLVSDRTLVVTSGLPFRLSAINLLSGRKVWSYRDDIFSNVVSFGGALYALRGDGKLAAVDIATGETIGLVELAPALATTEGWMPTYWLASCENTLYLYLGDSSELVALALVPR